MGKEQRREKERRLREQFIRPTGTIYHSTMHTSENSGPIFSGYRRRKQACARDTLRSTPRKGTHWLISRFEDSIYRPPGENSTLMNIYRAQNNFFVFFFPPSLPSSFPSPSSFTGARAKIRTSVLITNTSFIANKI